MCIRDSPDPGREYFLHCQQRNEKRCCSSRFCCHYFHASLHLVPFQGDVYKRQNSGSRHNLEVDFFGGEPLMNWQVVKDLVAYGREQEKIHNKKFRFTLTTNGVLLNDEVMEFCNKEMGNVVLSICLLYTSSPSRGRQSSCSIIYPPTES